jgi:D-lactate dehydrogenase (cytochrome)
MPPAMSAAIHPAPERDYPEYLHDESRRTGRADAIAFPESMDEAAGILTASRGRTVTVQGARTGVVGGAVPDGGLLLSFSRMDRILGVAAAADGTPRLRVQPGLSLRALRQFLDGAPADTSRWSEASRAAWKAARGARWFFPPDPTERAASLGGMAACNASGACSFAYGPTRRYVEALTLLLADGDCVELRRGRERARGLRFSLRTCGGRVLEGDLPACAPPDVKTAAGYGLRPGMDLIDLVIGSEGTLGAIAELELRLLPRPASTWAVLAFLPDEDRALDLVLSLRAGAGPDRRALGPLLTAIEYFDADALRLMRRSGPAAASGLPPLARRWRCAVYAEWSGDDPAAMAAAGRATVRRLRASAGHPDETWAAWSEPDLERLKEFRHAIPERVNAFIAERRREHPDLTKVGTDLAFPDDRLRDAMALYRRDLAVEGLESVVFGHVGDNHLHVNILPRDMRDYAAGRRLFETWARQAVAWGGSVAAEHGIGTLKRALLEIQYGGEGVAAMRRLKRVFDPDGRINPGVLFGP